MRNKLEHTNRGQKQARTVQIAKQITCKNLREPSLRDWLTTTVFIQTYRELNLHFVLPVYRVFTLIYSIFLPLLWLKILLNLDAMGGFVSSPSLSPGQVEEMLAKLERTRIERELALSEAIEQRKRAYEVRTIRLSRIID